MWIKRSNTLNHTEFVCNIKYTANLKNKQNTIYENMEALIEFFSRI